jgi:hypothetical protein
MVMVMVAVVMRVVVMIVTKAMVVRVMMVLMVVVVMAVVVVVILMLMVRIALMCVSCTISLSTGVSCGKPSYCVSCRRWRPFDGVDAFHAGIRSRIGRRR